MSNGWPGKVRVKDFPKKSTKWLQAEVKRVQKELALRQKQYDAATSGWQYWLHLFKPNALHMLEYMIRRLKRRLTALRAELARRAKRKKSSAVSTGSTGSTRSMMLHSTGPTGSTGSTLGSTLASLDDDTDLSEDGDYW